MNANQKPRTTLRDPKAGEPHTALMTDVQTPQADEETVTGKQVKSSPKKGKPDTMALLVEDWDFDATIRPTPNKKDGTTFRRPRQAPGSQNDEDDYNPVTLKHQQEEQYDDEALAPAQPTDRVTRHRLLPWLPPSAFTPGATASEAERTPLWGWLVLGLAAGLAAQLVSAILFRESAAFLGALLFTLCAVAGTIFPAFQLHAQSIWTGERSPESANRYLLSQLGLLFFGIFVAFALPVGVLGQALYEEWLPGSRILVDTQRITFEDLRVGGLLPTISHNLKVFMAFLVVGFIFSYLGIMFVIVYNAAIWGLTMMSVMAGTNALGAGKVTVAILPHLVLEIAAYTLAAMSGVFLVRALSRYRWLSPKLNRIAAGISQLILLGAIMVTIGAAIEYFWAGWLLADNTPGTPAIGHSQGP
jgi:uncharacterized membrane protein SpoIIM required for sporulation